jgi:hypothetical protein
VRILTTIRSAMNESRPINRLPPEMFAKVFEFRENERDLIAATHVCARWRTMLTSTPSLWTKIDFEDTTRASLYLERSKAALIDVNVGKTRSFIVGPEGAFLGAIPWVARMKSLDIRAEEGQIKTIAARLCHKTPNLQHLKLTGQPRSYQSAMSMGNTRSSGGAIYVPPDFLGRHAPELRSITFSSISPSVVFAFPLPKLTHIDWVAESAYVVIEELLDLFGTSPLLESIRMDVKVRRTRTYEPLRVVTLPELRRLDWSDREGAISLIPCLIAPQLNNLAVRVTLRPISHTVTFPTFLPPHGSHFPLLVEPNGLEYVYQNGARLCRFRYEEPAYFFVRELSDTRTVSNAVSQWLLPSGAISFAQIQELTVEASGGCPSLEDIPIKRFENLRSLALVGETDSLVSMIQPNHGSISGVPFHALSEIRITPKDSYFSFDHLAQVLEKRREAGYGMKTVKIIGEGRCLPGQVKELRKFVDKVIT